jgi:sodium-dependent phosphate cotransporter
MLLAIALALLALALKYLSGTIRQVITGKVERLVNGYLFSKPLRALVLGALVTALVQSSSVTTSLVVPMVAGGIFTLDKVFPFMLGSNIGTTITAILASMVTGSPAAITVALAHLTFNCCGTVIWYPLRWVPITLAKKLAYLAVNHKSIALAYVIILFYIIPLLIVFL